ncbi:MAG: hypothetical protein VX640_12825 [Pseudomonadota bacterium]|nr:hypothetical protein [Pseudomonadota bacterium]
MPAKNEDLSRKLETIAADQARIAVAIEGLDARLNQLADQVQKIAETSTRLKLMAGNAKEEAAKGASRLEAIENKLDRIEASAKR